MNKSLFHRLAPLFFALLAEMIFIPGLRAQTTPRPLENRVLLIFDTSAAMKKRVPAEVKGIQKLFALQLPGQVHTGDGIGVWTFDQDVRTGELPLRHWQYDATVDISSNIVQLLEGHRYAHVTSFAQLIPRLNRLVSDSARLTVLIFCDGDGQIIGTPVDASVNAIFKKNTAAMKKIHEPFVIVLRSQFGQYTGFTINIPDSINLPSFPPLPPPPQPVVAPAPPPPPAPVAQPLIIIGSTVKTNPPPEAQAPTPVPPPAPRPPAPTPPVVLPTPPPQTISTPPSSQPMTAPKPATETMPVPAIVMTPTNTAVPAPEATPPSAPSVPPATEAATETHGLSRPVMLAIGCGGLCVVAILAFIFLRLSRPCRSASLITESLKK